MAPPPSHSTACNSPSTDYRDIYAHNCGLCSTTTSSSRPMWDDITCEGCSCLHYPLSIERPYLEDTCEDLGGTCSTSYFWRCLRCWSCGKTVRTLGRDELTKCEKCQYPIDSSWAVTWQFHWAGWLKKEDIAKPANKPYDSNCQPEAWMGRINPPWRWGFLDEPKVGVFEKEMRRNSRHAGFSGCLVNEYVGGGIGIKFDEMPPFWYPKLGTQPVGCALCEELSKELTA